ncbi:MAG: hypothetical protein E7354_03375 [Clostridiales bacterium]|nr:hypothetical protein [Clostridiales bacterium]
MGVKEYITNKFNKKADKTANVVSSDEILKDKTSVRDRVKAVLDHLENVWTGTKDGFIDFVSANKGTIKRAALLGGALLTMLTTTACSADMDFDGGIGGWLGLDKGEDSAYHEKGEMPSGQLGVLGEDGNYYFGGDENTFVGDWVGDGYDSTVTPPANNVPSDDYNNGGTVNDNVIVEGDWVGDVGGSVNTDKVVVGEDVQVVQNNVVQYITVINSTVNITIGDGNTITISNGDANYTVNTGDIDYVVVKDQNGNIIGVVDVLTGQFTGIESITGPSEEVVEPEEEIPTTEEEPEIPEETEESEEEQEEIVTPPQVAGPCYIDALVSGLAGRPVTVLSMSLELDANSQVRVFDMDYMGVSGKFVSVACALEGGHLFNLQLPLEAFHLANGGNAVPDCAGTDMHNFYENAAQYAMSVYGMTLDSVPGYGEGMSR